MITEKRWQKAQKHELESHKPLFQKDSTDPLTKDYWREHLDIITQIRPDLNIRRILEVGCGPFGPIHYLDFGDRYGIDPLMDQYLLLKKDSQSIHFSDGKGEALPYSDNFFGKIICINVLDHVQDPMKVISEIYRTLRKNGILYFSVNTYGPIATAYKTVKEKLGKGSVYHPYTFTEGMVESKLLKSGFRALKKFRNLKYQADIRTGRLSNDSSLKLRDFPYLFDTFFSKDIPLGHYI